MTAKLIGNICPKCKGKGCPKCNGCGFNRSAAKTIFLGICYGMGGGKLCENLGLPLAPEAERKEYVKYLIEDCGFKINDPSKFKKAGEEGQRIITEFHKKVPFVKELAVKATQRAQQKGYVHTFLGRRCRFQKQQDEYIATHKALNRIIQGSSADQTKIAMIQADAAGFNLQLQVHDELDLSVTNKKEADELAYIMETCIKLRVPSKVDVEIGNSWGEAV
jgi:DNA polymerase I-like protein with 3'-5' exonuclease and polymerase domains